MEYSDEEYEYLHNEEIDSHNEENNSPHKKKNEITRGIAVMKRVIRARDKGVKYEVLWNDFGQPIGPTGAMFASFIGAVVRQHIPITCDHWNPQDKSMDPSKDFVFNKIQKSFLNVDDSRKKYVLKVAGKLHRCFRSFLTKNHLKHADGTFKDRPQLYEGLISPEEWTTFTAKRKTEKFQEVSAKNRERALKQEYPYRRGRLGYGLLTEKILKETKSNESFIDRLILWREGRVKDGVVNEGVQKVYEQCQTLSQSLSQDGKQTTSCRDILSEVLNVPEYSGRVRGMGLGVTPTVYFKRQKKSEKNPSAKQLMDIIQELKAEVHQLKKEKEKDMSGSKHNTHILSDKDSSNINVLKNIPEGVSHCALYLLSPTHRMVGKGKVYNIVGDILHHKPLPTGHVRVSVDVALELDVELPIPDELGDIRLVGDAIGSYVAWPRKLISLDVEIPANSKGNGNGEVRRGDESVTSKNYKLQEGCKSAKAATFRNMPVQTQKLQEGSKSMKVMPVQTQKFKVVTKNMNGGPSNTPFTKHKFLQNPNFKSLPLQRDIQLCLELCFSLSHL